MQMDIASDDPHLRTFCQAVASDRVYSVLDIEYR